MAESWNVSLAWVASPFGKMFAGSGSGRADLSLLPLKFGDLSAGLSGPVTEASGAGVDLGGNGPLGDVLCPVRAF